MTRDQTLQRILDGGLVAVVRAESGALLAKVVQALADGGIRAAEITFTVPNAIDVIKTCRDELGDSIVRALWHGLLLRLWMFALFNEICSWSKTGIICPSKVSLPPWQAQGCAIRYSNRPDDHVILNEV